MPAPLPIRVERSVTEPRGELADASSVAQERREAEADLKEKALRLKCLDYAASKAPDGASAEDIVMAAQQYLAFLSAKE